jgi:ABC-type branched-subunit amino acid transport system substrate-binding protein
MTSVQNRLQPLSGNKWLIFTVAGLLLAACSPKLRPVAVVPKPSVDTVTKRKPTEVKPLPPAVIPSTVISLLLPFHLDQLDLSKGTTRANIANANVAMEYYQGFKLALDSLTFTGANFKLQVFDTKEAVTETRNLALNTKVRTSALIVGPVYPDEIKSFTAAAPNLKKILVSPLSPALPSGYNAPNLVTVIPPLEYHTWRVANYVQGTIKAKKVFILRSGYSQDNKYIVPFKKALDSLSKKHIKVVELTVVHGDLTAILPQLSTTEQNIFIVPATDIQFLQVTLNALDVLVKRHYPVILFGHPNWEGIIDLKPELLQRLNTYITSTGQVNYHSAQVIKFLKDYRKAYHAEPGEYAIKGYDEGLYFGQLAALPNNANTNLPDFEAMHNNFHFVKIPGMGYVNTHVGLYKYFNFELKPVE